MKKIVIALSIFAFASCKQAEIKPIEEMSYEVPVDTLTVPEVKIDSLKIKELKSFFNHKSDEFSESQTTWITPKASAQFRNQNGLYCYFSNNNLRFVFQYHKDDWLFIRKCQFLIDGKPYEYTPTDIKRDNDSSGITEWFDERVDYSNKDIIEALANGKTAKVKLIGENYVDFKTITKNQMLSIKRTLEYYKALGNSF